MKRKCLTVPQGLVMTINQTAIPDADEVATDNLQKERKVYLDIDICPDVLAIQRMIMNWNMEDRGIPKEERKPIWIYIFSYGGDMDVMWTMVDTIALSTTPVYTVNVGIAASAASLIFLSGHKRFMLPKSELIIHEGSAEIAGDAGKVFDNVDAYKAAVKRMKAYILNVTHIPAATMNKKHSNDWHIDAEYCLANGACERIIESLDEVL